MTKLKPKNTTPKKPQRTSAKYKRQIFVEEYLRTLNATQSAIRAGYSENGARVTGHRLLAEPNIKAQIDEALSQRHEQCMVDAEFIIQNLKDIALNPATPCKDRVKALDLLGRYKCLWTGGEGKAPPEKIKVVLTDE